MLWSMLRIYIFFFPSPCPELLATYHRSTKTMTFVWTEILLNGILCFHDPDCESVFEFLQWNQIATRIKQAINERYSLRKAILFLRFNQIICLIRSFWRVVFNSCLFGYKLRFTHRLQNCNKSDTILLCLIANIYIQYR